MFDFYPRYEVNLQQSSDQEPSDVEHQSTRIFPRRRVCGPNSATSVMTTAGVETAHITLTVNRNSSTFLFDHSLTFYRAYSILSIIFKFLCALICIGSGITSALNDGLLAGGMETSPALTRADLILNITSVAVMLVTSQFIDQKQAYLSQIEDIFKNSGVRVSSAAICTYSPHTLQGMHNEVMRITSRDTPNHQNRGQDNAAET